MMHSITVPQILQRCIEAKQALQHARWGLSPVFCKSESTPVDACDSCCKRSVDWQQYLPAWKALPQSCIPAGLTCHDSNMYSWLARQ